MADGGSSSFGDVLSSGASTALPGVSAPVLSQIHVSCYVTAANRAAPVFEVLPQHNCVRVVNKASSDGASGGGGAVSTGSTGVMTPAAEWDFHSVFSSTSPSHAIDFFTEITLPALRTARDGINSNIVVWGVHPTQKFRLLFGKSVGGGGFAPQPEMAVNDVVELYGQLVGMLHAFFTRLDLGSRPLQDEPWRLGISSWIIVNNQAIDLLKSPIGGASTEGSRMPSTQAEPLSFVSLEATSLASAFRIVQTAKTNRIVRKQNAESAHFFVRLAIFHGGQVSTVHLVDLIDQKEFQDPILNQEKYEFYNILQGLRQPSLSPKQTGDRPGAMSSTGKMVLSNFTLPLLTANAKTFLYANVIDSRSSLRESVQMLNAVANLRGFACVCKPLRGVAFEQLHFQASPDEERQEIFGQATNLNTPDSTIDSKPTLNRASTSPPLGASSARTFSPMNQQALERDVSIQQPPQTRLSASLSEGVFELEAMSWLSDFAQRKRSILGGSIDTIDTVASVARVPEIRPPFRGDEVNDQSDATLEAQATITDLYEQLRESLEDVKEIELAGSESPRGSYCSLHSLPPGRSTPESHPPLPIVDREAEQEDLPRVGYSRSTIGGIARHQLQQSHQQNQEELPPWSQFNRTALDRGVSQANMLRPEVDASEVLEAEPVVPSLSAIDSSKPMLSSLSAKPDKFTAEAFKKAGLHPCILEPPNLNGLDAKTAEKVQAADATLLRKNYDALLSIVREQQQAKEAAEARAAEALQDQEEQRAMFEVQIENMKLANVGLRSKVRALENRTSLPQVFEQYEQELRTLHAQVEELQARNVALELRVGGDGNVGPGGSATEIKKKYQQVVEEKLALERELMEHRRRERHHQVHSRLAGESTRRVDQLSRDLNNKEEDLVATRLSKQRLSAEMNQALEKADQLHHENEKLLQEKAATTEELLATRMYLASLENEKKKASILDRFVEKHGDRMNRLRQHGQSSSGNNWRRDQYARECEDKLLATVKRSLPQAVPLCNKLLRRLEMQELSLREFSEREVDFINLLVELVSDQPTVSLKQMIEQEMKKLQSC